MGSKRQPNEYPDNGHSAHASSSTISPPSGASPSPQAVDASGASRWLREAWNLGRVLLLLALVMILSFAGIQPDQELAKTLGIASLALLLLLLVDRTRYLIVWAVYVVGLVVFSYLRIYADDWGFATRYEYVIELERTVFFGHVPTVWLQQRFYEFEQASPLVIYLMVIYLSYFVVPYAVAAALWTWRRRHFVRYIAGLLTTFYIGLLIYMLVPTSPPWLSAEEGYLPHVFRVVRDITYNTNPFIYQAGEEIVGKNDVAAMPSLHFGITLIVMLALWQYGRGFRIAGVIYTVSMAVALMYLGEHYFIDILVGGIIGAVGWWAIMRWVSPSSFIDKLFPTERADERYGHD